MTAESGRVGTFLGTGGLYFRRGFNLVVGEDRVVNFIESQDEFLGDGTNQSLDSLRTRLIQRLLVRCLRFVGDRRSRGLVFHSPIVLRGEITHKPRVPEEASGRRIPAYEY